MATLIIPGLNSSGPAHWQTWLEQTVADSRRVQLRDWVSPDLAVWTAAIRRAIAQTRGEIFLVGHSFGALAAAQAGNDYSHRIAGALLVAPADPENFGIGELLPQGALGFPSVVVASANDPWMKLDAAANWARRWQSDFVSLGDAGHINTESGYGPWPAGLDLLRRLQQDAGWHDARARQAQLPISALRRRIRGAVDTRLATEGRGTTLARRSAAASADIRRAVVLLEDAGWRVSPPIFEASVASA